MDPLERLQRDIAGYLGSEASSKLAAYHYVPIITSNDRTAEAAMMVQDLIDKALAGLIEKNGKSGLAVIILDPEAGVPMEHMAGPYIEILQVIRIVENKLINMGETGTQIPCAELAIDTLSALHLWQPGRIRELRGESRKAMERVRTNDDNLIVWELNLSAMYQVTPVAATEPPAIALEGPLPDVLCTLTCRDAGADIWYTLDGTFPSPNNAGASLYAEPFTIADACTVRAVAYFGSFLPSAIAEADVSVLIDDTESNQILDMTGHGIGDTGE